MPGSSPGMMLMGTLLLHKQAVVPAFAGTTLEREARPAPILKQLLSLAAHKRPAGPTDAAV